MKRRAFLSVPIVGWIASFFVAQPSTASEAPRPSSPVAMKPGDTIWIYDGHGGTRRQIVSVKDTGRLIEVQTYCPCCDSERAFTVNRTV